MNEYTFHTFDIESYILLNLVTDPKFDWPSYQVQIRKKANLRLENMSKLQFKQVLNLTKFDFNIFGVEKISGLSRIDREKRWLRKGMLPGFTLS